MPRKRTWLQRRLKPKKFKGEGVPGPALLPPTSAGGLITITWVWDKENPATWTIQWRYKIAGVWSDWEDVAFPAGIERTQDIGFSVETDAQIRIRSTSPWVTNWTTSQEFAL